MQQSCTYGSVRGAFGQPASLPRQSRPYQAFCRRFNIFCVNCFLVVWLKVSCFRFSG